MKSIIPIKIIPEIVLILIMGKKLKPGILRSLEDNSAKNPMIEYIIMAKKIIIEKFLIVTFSGFKTGFIKPAWSEEESLAPRILTRFPLSPEKSGTRVRRLGFLRSVLIELFKKLPAVTPKNEQISKTGVDCFIIFFISPPAFIPYINPKIAIKITNINTTFFKIILDKNETEITASIMAGSVNRSPKAAIIGVDMLSGSQPFSKLFRDINIVNGNIITLEIIPANIEISVKSIKLMLSNPNNIHIPLAKKAKKIDSIMVKMREDNIFSDKILERLNSGDNKPICRFVANLDPRAPNIFPLIPIAPGIMTKRPGKAVKKSVIFPRMIPANKSPIAHIKRAVNASPNTFFVSLKKCLNLLPIK